MEDMFATTTTHVHFDYTGYGHHHGISYAMAFINIACCLLACPCICFIWWPTTSTNAALKLASLIRHAGELLPKRNHIRTQARIIYAARSIGRRRHKHRRRKRHAPKLRQRKLRGIFLIALLGGNVVAQIGQTQTNRKFTEGNFTQRNWDHPFNEIENQINPVVPNRSTDNNT